MHNPLTIILYICQISTREFLILYIPTHLLNGMYPVWWRLDGTCQKKQKSCTKHPKWWTNCIDTNRRGLYQSNRHNPGKPLYKHMYLFSERSEEWQEQWGVLWRPCWTLEQHKRMYMTSRVVTMSSRVLFEGSMIQQIGYIVEYRTVTPTGAEQAT